MLEKLIAVLERIAVALEKTRVIETEEVIAKVAEPAAAPKRTRRTKAEMVAATTTTTSSAAIITTPTPAVLGAAAPLASVPVTRDTVRAALIAYSNKTSQDATLALLEKIAGTKVMSKVPEDKFQAVLDALAAPAAPNTETAPSPFNG